MAKKQEFVKEITSREENFSQWYTDVILKTQMVDYGPVKGTMVIRPYGYRIWELIQQQLDARFKECGVQNAYFPLLIPESLLKKEAEHVEGFAPEVAWVTKGGHEELAEPLVVRPTSETIFCDMFSKWVQSYRDLPMKLNQWCNVMRWEKSTRPFLRTSEFLWQEGHTIHSTQEEALEMTMQMIGVYGKFAEEVLAMPVIIGQKSDKERFAGAVATYSMEAMMQDGQALQAGTSHNLGQHFAKVFDIKFLGKDGVQEYVHQTSWGVSTRLIGGLIMTHSDDRGLVLPPRVAPIQAVVLPIAMHKEGVIEGAEKIVESLKAAGIRTEFDTRDQSAGWKFNEWEMKGVPVRIEVGPRDLEAGQVTIMRRDTLEKSVLPIEGLAEAIVDLLDDVQEGLLCKARGYRDERIFEANDLDELREAVEDKHGFASTMWCGSRECEDLIKEKTGATSRVMPFEQKCHGDKCVCCGKPATVNMLFARSY
ncbi:MAG: proline--tRNA ligase [Clostridia bacterium]|nr:proline--tRNA ligase [Clostridia bacterium]